MRLGGRVPRCAEGRRTTSTTERAVVRRQADCGCDGGRAPESLSPARTDRPAGRGPVARTGHPDLTHAPAHRFGIIVCGRPVAHGFYPLHVRHWRAEIRLT